MKSKLCGLCGFFISSSRLKEVKGDISDPWPLWPTSATASMPQPPPLSQDWPCFHLVVSIFSNLISSAQWRHINVLSNVSLVTTCLQILSRPFTLISSGFTSTLQERSMWCINTAIWTNRSYKREGKRIKTMILIMICVFWYNIVKHEYFLLVYTVSYNMSHNEHMISGRKVDGV